MGTVINIHRVATRGGPTELLAEANYLTNFGLEGDWRSRKGRGRQITLIEAEALERVADILHMDEIPAGASRRQVLVRGISLNDTVGKKLRVGPLLIEVHDLCDPCKNMETMIGPGAWWAMEKRGGICARVLEGGILRPGDTIEVVTP
jgi:MOSC domain-containing protein YiiM